MCIKQTAISKELFVKFSIGGLGSLLTITIWFAFWLQCWTIGTSIIAHCYYTTLPYHLSIARYAGIYRHAAGPCGWTKLSAELKCGKLTTNRHFRSTSVILFYFLLGWLTIIQCLLIVTPRVIPKRMFRFTTKWKIVNKFGV